MNKIPVSVFIIAKDEEDRIGKTINSVINWVDEVIVIDSGSNDNTVEISKKLGATTIFNKWQGYGPQKIFGETLCKNKWLLNLDADEEISDALAQEIIALFKNTKPSFNAYKMRIKIMSRFDKKPRLLAPYHNQIRLYDIDYAGFKNSTVHDSVIAKDSSNCKINQLKNIVYHRSFRSYRHAIEKINRYSSMQAEDMYNSGRNPSTLRIILEPFVSFIKGYFKKKYCFMGIDGFIEAWIYSFSRTLRIIKTREIFNDKHRKKYDDGK